MGRNLGKPLGSLLLRFMQLHQVEKLSDLADRLGLPYSTVRNWHTRDAVPDEYIERAMRTFNASDAWLRYGQGSAPVFFNRSSLEIKKSAAPTHLHSVQESVSFEHSIERYDLNVIQANASGHELELVLIPRYKVGLSAGYGNLVTSDIEMGVDIAFSPSWMRAHLGRLGGGFAMADVDGRSMEPTLLDGESIILDLQRRDIEGGGIFALRIDDELMVKRLQRKLNGTVLVLSDNDAFEPEEISAEQARDLEVIGRVVWPRVR